MEFINDISLRLLQTFLAVASEGSFRLVAERLNRELSPAARHLADKIVSEVRRVTGYVEEEKFFV